MADTAADRSRRPAWWPLAVAALVVPTVLAGLTLLWPRTPIEDELTRTGSDALSAAGFGGAAVSFEGRDGTINGVPAADGQRAVEVVENVTGVRVAALPAEPAAPAEPGPGPAEPIGSPSAGAGAGAVAAQPFTIARRGDDLVLTGVVGSEEERARLVAAATAQSAGRSVIDELTVTPGTPLPDGVDDASLGAGAGVLAAAAADLAFDFSSGGVTLTGTVADDAARAAAEQAVVAATPGIDVDNQLVVPPPAPPAGSAGGPDLDATARQQLQDAVDGLLAASPITFEPDSSQPTAQGGATVARLLELVVPAPAARLQVDGFVASGPGRGVLTAQQLSDQRAAVVRDALVAGGVPGDRVTARGLGEGDTPAAGAAGRRVEITVI